MSEKYIKIVVCAVKVYNLEINIADLQYMCFLCAQLHKNYNDFEAG